MNWLCIIFKAKINGSKLPSIIGASFGQTIELAVKCAYNYLSDKNINIICVIKVFNVEFDNVPKSFRVKGKKKDLSFLM